MVRKNRKKWNQIKYCYKCEDYLPHNSESKCEICGTENKEWKVPTLEEAKKFISKYGIDPVDYMLKMKKYIYHYPRILQKFSKNCESFDLHQLMLQKVVDEVIKS